MRLAIEGSSKLVVFVLVLLTLIASSRVQGVKGQNVIEFVPVSPWPRGVAVDPATNMVYVAGSNNWVIQVINASTDRLSSSVSVGGQPYGVSVNAETNTVYASIFSAGMVAVINGSTNRVVANVTVGSSPYGVTVNSRTNMVYVANFGSNTISVISGASNTVVANVAVGNNPQGVAVDPSTNMVYVANNGDGTVSVVDGSTNQVTATVSIGLGPLGGGPVAVAVNPNTNKVYVASATNNGNVTVIDGSTNKVVKNLPTGGYPTDIANDPSTNMVYMTISCSYGCSAQSGGRVVIIDGSDDSVVALTQVVNPNPNLPLPCDSHYCTDNLLGVAVDPATNKVYVSDFDIEQLPSGLYARGGSIAVISGVGLPTITVVSCTLSSLDLGRSTTCVATVPGTSSGMVTWSATGQGTASLFPETCALSSGQCGVVVTATREGPFVVQAFYEGDATHSSSEGVFMLSATVPRALTSLTVSCANISIQVGVFVPCSVNLTGSSPSGDVTFSTTSATGTFTPLNGKCKLNAGTCSVTYTDAAISNINATISAAYPGDTYNTAASGSFPLKVVKPSTTLATATSSLTMNSGKVTADQAPTTGISVQISGSSATDGTPVAINTEDLSSPNPGTVAPDLTSPKYYDVRVSGLTDGTARVCVNNAAAGSSTRMEYWNGNAWTSAYDRTINLDTGAMCANIPVYALTGTNIVVGNTAQQNLPPTPLYWTNYTLVYIAAGVIALVVVAGIFLVLRRRSFKSESR